MEKEIDNKIHPVFFEKKVEISPDTFEVYFKIEGEFQYKPGQYVWLQLPNMKKIDACGDRRAFSILKTQDSEKNISFLFRRGQSNFKKSVLELETNERVNIIGPFGSTFCLPDDIDTKLVLISGGVGISPFINLINFSEEGKTKYSIDLLAFNRKDERLYETELKKIKNKKFNYQIINDKPETSHFKKIEDGKTLYYISGSQVFVDEVFSILIKKGIDPVKMRFENFYPMDENTKTLEELLKKESEADYDNGGILLSAIKSSSHHVLITDKNAKIIFANQAAQDITGYSFTEMKNNTPRLWGGLMSDDFYKKLWYSKLSGEVINAEIINRRKNGEIYNVISHIAAIKNGLGEIVGFIATEEDITKIKKQEEKILKINKELEKFTLLMADRELKMIELKKELQSLKDKLND